jgi:hypothetical protein
MPRQSKDTLAILGIDIGKNTFHLVGLNERGSILLRQKLSAAYSNPGLPTSLPASSAWRPVSSPPAPHPQRPHRRLAEPG